MHGTGDMAPDTSAARQRRNWNRALALAALALIVVSTAGHYMTDMHAVHWHNVFRRLYYVPIVLASFAYGLRGGLGAAIVACIAYAPHAFFMDHMDPAPTVDKVLEFVLYLAVGGLTGWLVQRQRGVQARLESSLAAHRTLEAQLVRAGRLSALGRLTSGLAHEIRNPLASVLGAAEALGEDYPEGHRKHRIATLLLREIRRLDKVVSDFLRFARPREPQRAQVDLADIGREVLQLTAAQARAVGVEVRDELPDRLLAQGDRGQLGQVLLNVTLNAYQCLEDQAQREVSFVAARRSVAGATLACIGVQDSGPGIPDETREDIFDPYFTTREDGTGLGLSISSRIAEAHDGFLDIQSQPGRTTVWLCLPAEGS